MSSAPKQGLPIGPTTTIPPIATEVQASLESVGAPRISRDHFRQLFTGQLGEALLFLSQQLKGRQAVADARRAISIHQATSHSRVVKDDPSADGMKKVLKLRSEDINRLQRQHDELFHTMNETEAQMDQLRATLRLKQLRVLLLSTLEKREATRNARFSQIAQELKLASADTPSKWHSAQQKFPPVSHPLSFTRTIFCFEKTRDTLALLQEYHNHLVETKISRSSLGSMPDRLQTEYRLRRAISRFLQLPEDDAKVKSQVAQIIESVRRGVVAELSGLSSIQGGNAGNTITEVQLIRTSNRVKGKEKALQKTIDYLAALRFSCAQHLQALSVHKDAAVPTLKESLQQDMQAARGYVDALRLSINTTTSLLPNSRSDNPFEHLSGMKTERITADLRRDVTNAFQQERFVQAAQVERMQVKPVVTKAIRSYTAAEAEVNKKTSELFSRKSAKKETVGDVLVEEIVRLKKEVDMLASGAL